MLRMLSDALRPQALLEFELPVAPTRMEPLPGSLPGGEALRVLAPAGPLLLLIGGLGPLTLAFEATLFDLLAEAHFPAPAPRRARSGGLIARLQGPDGPCAAACYRWPPGEPLEPQLASAPQLLEVGRLLARLHLLGGAHPAQVADPLEGAALAARLPDGEVARALAPILRESLAGLPLGAAHGRPWPAQFFFLGDRCSAVVPAGAASSRPLVLDLADALHRWALPLPEPLPPLRAIMSGYQSLRRLLPEEREALVPLLRRAAARAGALRLLAGDADGALPALAAAEALEESEVRAAAG